LIADCDALIIAVDEAGLFAALASGDKHE